MQKFDTSCGLSRKEIGTVKYSVKNGMSRQLPELPDSVETKLFIQGRNAWIFSWRLLNQKVPIKSDGTVSLEVVAKLKREFYHYQSTAHYKFSCKVRIRRNDLYHPDISVAKGSS